jgi:hypothetical protein
VFSGCRSVALSAFRFSNTKRNKGLILKSSHYQVRCSCFVHLVCFSDNTEEMISLTFFETCSKIVIFVVSPLVLCMSLFVTAPFGRHEEGDRKKRKRSKRCFVFMSLLSTCAETTGSSRLWGARVGPRLAWILMETPNFVCVYFFLQG